MDLTKILKLACSDWSTAKCNFQYESPGTCARIYAVQYMVQLYICAKKTCLPRTGAKKIKLKTKSITPHIQTKSASQPVSRLCSRIILHSLTLHGSWGPQQVIRAANESYVEGIIIIITHFCKFIEYGSSLNYGIFRQQLTNS